MMSSENEEDVKEEKDQHNFHNLCIPFAGFGVLTNESEEYVFVYE